ncbi:MAG: SDR family oxidoreductase [Acidimicrobiia bacterium]|nr:SDR family oxidoreductase [Actinomycetota bacterium]
MDLAGKVAVVTGGASGIGAALAKAFAAQGAQVAVADLNRPGAEEVAAAVGGIAFETDVSQETSNAALIDTVEGVLGPVDLFCANAGIAFAGSEQSPDEDWDRMWRVNFLSHVYAARYLIPRWTERGGGYFLATASAAGLLTNLGAAQYAVTKHAVVAFAEWLSITYADDGIRVSCLCPQGVLTPILENAGEVIEFLRTTAITPEQVAADVVSAIAEEQFLILPHPEVARYEQRRASDREGWLEGMRQLGRNLKG